MGWQAIPVIAFLISCGMLLYADSKDRGIHIGWFAMMFVAAAFLPMAFKGHFFYNCLLVSTLFTGTWAYFSIKAGRSVNLLKDYIAIGDWVFLMICALIFPFQTFLMHIAAGSLLALIFWLAGRQWWPQRFQDNTLPYAGYLSVYVAVWVLFQITF